MSSSVGSRGKITFGGGEKIKSHFTGARGWGKRAGIFFKRGEKNGERHVGRSVNWVQKLGSNQASAGGQ